MIKTQKCIEDQCYHPNNLLPNNKLKLNNEMKKYRTYPEFVESEPQNLSFVRNSIINMNDKSAAPCIFR